MKTTLHMAQRRGPARLCAALAAVGLGIGLAGADDSDFKIGRLAPGGIDPHPSILSITTTQGVRVEWTGVQGPYQVQTKSTVDGTTVWKDAGPATNGHVLVLPKGDGAVFHRVVGGVPQYQGNQACADCHGPALDDWAQTKHGKAFDTLKAVGQQNNPACVICHTVGATAPGGFVSESATPQFLNVQCENCHGPAGDHVGSGDPPTIFPIVTRSAMVCGGCHNGFHHPTYDDWTTSPHSRVIEDLVGDFSSTNRTTAIGRMSTCGACHSGASRLAMLDAYTKFTGNNRTNVLWPSGYEATNTAVTCIVCHDTHKVHVYKNPNTGESYTNQLRNPMASKVSFSYNTGTNFASQYNPDVNLCGQCHNARGATVGSSGRPPHYSPQYNIFLGTIGVTNTTTPPQGAHMNNPIQCAGCHTHGSNEANPTANDPAYTGHGFKATLGACTTCHTETSGPKSPAERIATTQADVKARLAEVKALLDQWATTKNTNAWAGNYKALGWEYTSPGELSNPNAVASIVGPSSTEQNGIPQAIKDARFNAYLVSRDKSYGIHNAPYIKYLLDVAKDKVNAELSKP